MAKTKRFIINAEPKEHKQMREDAKSIGISSLSAFVMYLWYQWRQNKGGTK